MRSPALLLVVLSLAAAGCLGGDPPAGDGGETPPPAGPAPIPSGVWAYDVAGNLLPSVPADLGAAPSAQLLSVGQSGAEPTIGITSDGTLFFQALRDTLRSTDGGASWKVVHQVPLSLDPMLWVDTATDRVFANHLYVGCSYAAWSDDLGESWTTNPITCGMPVNDHQKLSTGPAVGPIPTVGYPSIVYYCYNGISHSACSTSHDGGITWKNNVAVGPEGCGGLHGHQSHAPDGTTYLPKAHCGDALVAISRDGGFSWETVVADDEHGSGGDDNEVAVDAAGNAYYAYTDRAGVPRVSASADGGATWGPGVQLSPPAVKHGVFPVAVGGSEGRFVAAYLGSDHPGDFARPDDAPADARWHLYVTYGVRGPAGNLSFVTLRATPADDPVQVGSICLSGIGCDGGDRNLLDFIDVVRDANGTVYVAYADGCTEGCAGNADAKPEDSRDRLGMVAVVRGPRLVDG